MGKFTQNVYGTKWVKIFEVVDIVGLVVWVRWFR